MCYIVEPDVVLAYLLSTGDMPVSIRRLKEIRKVIESQLPNVMVDISDDAIGCAVETRGQMFRWQNDKVVRAEHADRFFSATYLENHISWRMPPAVRSAVLEATKLRCATETWP